MASGGSQQVDGDGKGQTGTDASDVIRIKHLYTETARSGMGKCSSAAVHANAQENIIPDFQNLPAVTQGHRRSTGSCMFGAETAISTALRNRKLNQEWRSNTAAERR